MRLDLYLTETARLAADQAALLEQVADRLEQGSSPLTPLEQNGVLHALQVLSESAIGKAKHLLKAAGRPVPVSAYDAFKDLASIEKIPQQHVTQWCAIVGLRNRIVHEYMSIDFAIVERLVAERRYRFVVDFLQVR